MCARVAMDATLAPSVARAQVSPAVSIRAFVSVATSAHVQPADGCLLDGERMFVDLGELIRARSPPTLSAPGTGLFPFLLWACASDPDALRTGSVADFQALRG